MSNWTYREHIGGSEDESVLFGSVSVYVLTPVGEIKEDDLVF